MENNIASRSAQVQVYAVIGGIDYEGEQFDTLRLFDSKAMAEAYAEELENELCIDYVLTKIKNVEARV
jgi:hypothetical protein